MKTNELIAILRDEDDPNVLDYIQEAADTLQLQKVRIMELETELNRVKAERRWIPVAERLPEDNIPSTAYLCWWRGHTHICKYWRTRKCFEFNGRVVNVTHWMPIPEPPKEGI